MCIYIYVCVCAFFIAYKIIAYKIYWFIYLFESFHVHIFAVQGAHSSVRFWANNKKSCQKKGFLMVLPQYEQGPMLVMWTSKMGRSPLKSPVAPREITPFFCWIDEFTYCPFSIPIIQCGWELSHICCLPTSPRESNFASHRPWRACGTWGATMSACEKGECPLAALRLFEEMPVVKIKPDTWLITWENG